MIGFEKKQKIYSSKNEAKKKKKIIFKCIIFI
jgi:hypothetical protein